MASINEKLTRVDESISSLKNTFGLDKSTPIDEIEGFLTPDKGIIIEEWDENGLPTVIKTIGFTELNNYYFAKEASDWTYGGYFWQNVKKITLNKEIKIIGDNSFQHLKNLETVVFPSALEEIKKYAFYGCSKLVITELPDSLCRTGTYMFSGCPNFKITKLPASLGNGCGFYQWQDSGIAIKTVPDEVTNIGRGAFAGCLNITQLSSKGIMIFDAVNYTDGGLYGCTNLKAVWIGPSIQEISNFTFCKCTSLGKIFIDKPRAEVEALSGYNYCWSQTAYNGNPTLTPDIIVCNDDEGFMSKEEFDVIDWSTYTE